MGGGKRVPGFASKVRFAADSPLEESGFEPSVAARKQGSFGDAGPINCGHLASASGINVARDQKFESTSLQQRVTSIAGQRPAEVAKARERKAECD
jgi:hypothetical protein